MIQVEVDRAFGKRVTSAIYRDRKIIASTLAQALNLNSSIYYGVVDTIRANCSCFAGMLGAIHAGRQGYANTFTQPKLFSGRMAEAAQWGPPTEVEVADKPWLRGLPRLIFISDMGDALSARIAFEHLDQEIIGNVTSTEGRNHVWLWPSKRPERMAAFGQWLVDRGGAWPVNLVAMTMVTCQHYAYRAESLRRVPAPFKSLSVIPGFEPVKLNLKDIDWVIVGGASDPMAGPFDVEWALDLWQQCRAQGVPFFLKQLGRRPIFDGPSSRWRTAMAATGASGRRNGVCARCHICFGK